jgi:hypothetical protein
MVGALRTAALVTMHAARGGRPDWFEDPPRPEMVQAPNGPNAMVVGEYRGRNLYTAGSYCPLKWSPSPLSSVRFWSKLARRADIAGRASLESVGSSTCLVA